MKDDIDTRFAVLVARVGLAAFVIIPILVGLLIWRW